MKKDYLGKLFALFVIFFKAGTFTFAGGLAMLPVIEKDVVEKYALMGKDEFMEYATLSQTLPGVIALNCASLVGQKSAGIPGMLAAGFGATFSAFALMVLATVLISIIPQSGPVVGAFKGIRAASAALVLSAAFSLGKHNLKSMFAAALAAAAFISITVFGVNALIVVIAAGITGFAYVKLGKSKKGAGK